MSSPSYDDFVNRFGLEDVRAIIDAANGHKNGIHDKPGSDYFRWAILICIGFECMSKDAYREEHGIKTPWRTLDGWLKEPAQREWFAAHNGDVDFIALLAGTYHPYMPASEPEATEASINEKWMPTKEGEG